MKIANSSYSILFVCTGNIFRSLVAECAVKARMGERLSYLIGSAGTEAVPQAIHPVIRECLLAKGIDPARHVQRRLTLDLLEGASLVVAMGLNHRAYIRDRFGRDVLLFNQVCYDREEPILDIHEAIADWPRNPVGAGEYARTIVSYIWDAVPAFIDGVARRRASAT